jgi:hypothetical protein
MVFEAEAECVPRIGRSEAEQNLIDRKIQRLWRSASHCHFNRDFRFNSQSTAMQFSRRRSLGGRAWLSIKSLTTKHEKALVLWGNSSIGMLLYWWFANKQHAGRGSIGKSSLENLIVLNVLQLTNGQLDAAGRVFDAFACLPLLPLHKINQDENRRQLDEALMSEVLGIPADLHDSDGAMELLRFKLSREPSILGHKKPVGSS